MPPQKRARRREGRHPSPAGRRGTQGKPWSAVAMREKSIEAVLPWAQPAGESALARRTVPRDGRTRSSRTRCASPSGLETPEVRRVRDLPWDAVPSAATKRKRRYSPIAKPGSQRRGTVARIVFAALNEEAPENTARARGSPPEWRHRRSGSPPEWRHRKSGTPPQ